MVNILLVAGGWWLVAGGWWLVAGYGTGMNCCAVLIYFFVLLRG